MLGDFCIPSTPNEDNNFRYTLCRAMEENTHTRAHDFNTIYCKTEVNKVSLSSIVERARRVFLCDPGRRILDDLFPDSEYDPPEPIIQSTCWPTFGPSNRIGNQWN